MSVYMILHTKPQVTQTPEFILQQRWVNTYHIRKVWNQNLSQILGMGKLSIANEDHNIKNDPNKQHFR